MTPTHTPIDVAIIGGGLSGMLAAYRLGSSGLKVTLLDHSLPEARGRLGGFAEFSGAKFSLLPAGQGLIPVAGSPQALHSISLKVLDFLGLDHAVRAQPDEADFATHDHAQLALRSYKSVVLSPDQMRRLLEDLEIRVRQVATLMGARVVDLAGNDQSWDISLAAAPPIRAGKVLYAGGRLGDDILLGAGAIRQAGKGLDVGVRVEFSDKAGLAGLRALGPDAKMLLGRVRTFCLNSPGKVYRYPFGSFSIPGGVVADPDTQSANVGLLVRVAHKERMLKQVRATLANLESDFEAAPIGTETALVDKLELIRDAFGSAVADDLIGFSEAIASAGLVDWRSPHSVHFPLLDWHWNVYALPGTHRTSEEGLFVVGDSAGHARGLLQAAVSGWLAAGAIIDAGD